MRTVIKIDGERESEVAIPYQFLFYQDPGYIIEKRI